MRLSLLSRRIGLVGAGWSVPGGLLVGRVLVGATGLVRRVLEGGNPSTKGPGGWGAAWEEERLLAAGERPEGRDVSRSGERGLEGREQEVGLLGQGRGQREGVAWGGKGRAGAVGSLAGAAAPQLTVLLAGACPRAGLREPLRAGSARPPPPLAPPQRVRLSPPRLMPPRSGPPGPPRRAVTRRRLGRGPAVRASRWGTGNPARAGPGPRGSRKEIRGSSARSAAGVSRGRSDGPLASCTGGSA